MQRTLSIFMALLVTLFMFVPMAVAQKHSNIDNREVQGSLNWQYGAASYIYMTVRNRNGQAPCKIAFVVTSDTGETFQVDREAKGDEFVTVVFPNDFGLRTLFKDFGLRALPQGKYIWKCYSEGKEIERVGGKFNVIYGEDTTQVVEITIKASSLRVPLDKESSAEPRPGISPTEKKQEAPFPSSPMTGHVNTKPEVNQKPVTVTADVDARRLPFAHAEYKDRDIRFEVTGLALLTTSSLSIDKSYLHVSAGPDIVPLLNKGLADKWLATGLDGTMCSIILEGHVRPDKRGSAVLIDVTDFFISKKK